MVEHEVFNDPPVILRLSARSVARNVWRAMLELAHDYSRAQQAAVLAEAHCKHPARMRALYLNDLAELSNCRMRRWIRPPIRRRLTHGALARIERRGR